MSKHQTEHRHGTPGGDHDGCDELALDAAVPDTLATDPVWGHAIERAGLHGSWN